MEPTRFSTQKKAFKSQEKQKETELFFVLFFHSRSISKEKQLIPTCHQFKSWIFVATFEYGLYIYALAEFWDHKSVQLFDWTCNFYFSTPCLF